MADLILFNDGRPPAIAHEEKGDALQIFSFCDEKRMLEAGAMRIEAGKIEGKKIRR
jgi:hypothetical protein